MPLVSVQMLEGRSAEVRRTLIRSIGETVAATLDVPEAAIRITLVEVSPENWGVGARTLHDLRSGTGREGESS